MQPEHDTNAPKRPVNLSLNADLVARVRGVTGNLSEAVEGLLVEFLEERQTEKDAHSKALRETITTWNNFGDHHGSFVDEHSTLSMAQFDAHRNHGSNARVIPYVLAKQSAIFNDYRRRVVIPLVKQSSLDQLPYPRFNPTFIVEGAAVVLHPLEVVSVATSALGEFVQSLAEENQRIIDALDDLITRAHG